jgi:3-isopropylmalate/(R)-2-methylmalate dehydratase small subunit
MVASYSGTAVVLRRDDVDTDQIVAAEYCKRITKTGYADVLFGRWREDPAFVLNQPGAREAKVLVAGHNFGTGSSREHAVWALRDWGFESVIATGFGDIFHRNALKNRLVPVRLAAESVQRLAELVEAEPRTTVTVDLTELVVRAGGESYRFAIDERAHRLLLGDLDEIAATLTAEDAIAAHERSRFDWLPVVQTRAPAQPPNRTPTTTRSASTTTTGKGRVS